MSDNNGILDLLPNGIPLEVLIEQRLNQVPTEHTLSNKVADATDRKRLRYNYLIIATLDAVLEQSPTEVELNSQTGLRVELANAIRAYKHDVSLLEAGRAAQQILKPIMSDIEQIKAPVSANRKELIIWLAVIHLHQSKLDSRFPTQAKVIEYASKKTGRSAPSLKTELSNFKTQVGPSDDQVALFWDYVDWARVAARTDGDETRAFTYLLPAALAISEAIVR